MNSQQRRAARAAEARRAANRRRTPWVALVAVVVVAGALLVALRARASSSDDEVTATTAPPALLAAVTGVPGTVASAVGLGTATAPKPITAPALTKDGKPLVVYLGAEYCPFCAAERWGVVIALSRFGTFSGLRITTSSSTDVYASTPTFSFHGAVYQSDHVAFEGVELQGNELSGGTYPTLDTPTDAQRQLLETYDAPPYVDARSAGSIPFVDLGGRYLVSGASYSPAVLAGLTHQQIADQLDDPGSPVAKGAVGTANALTAAICRLTAGEPAAVCADPAVTAIQAKLG
jgi:hypothetical protein